MEVIVCISTVILVYLGICTAYLLVFAIAGRLTIKKVTQPSIQPPIYKIAVLIPAYKEDAVILEVARQSLLQSYPQHLYEVVIICDSLLDQTLAALEALPVRLIKVQFSNPTKAKAINAALQQLPAYDIAIILDADNIMEEDFLQKISQLYHQGYTVVQGHRSAKNTNTSVAVLDAISEEINNHIFRKGHCALGLSSALIGSAMAFNYQLFKEKMQTISAVSGFDKELELAILKEGIYIHYAEDALVYDEKVQRVADFRNQRIRWLAAQIQYLFTYFFSGLLLFFKGNINYSDKVFQFLLLPRVMMLGLITIVIFLSVFIQHIGLILFSYMILIMLIITLYIAAPKRLMNHISWRELLHIPILLFHFILSLIQARKARYTFIHTPHGEIKPAESNSPNID